jgi:uncharacterized membrane protein YidH (DUF202 family)
MNVKEKEIKGLDTEIILSVIFIFTSLMNIYGDKIQKKFLLTGEKNEETRAKNWFALALIISIIIYLYYVYRNYNSLKEAVIKNENINKHYIRLFGTILIVVGALCLLYFVEESTTPIGQPAI